LAKFFFFAFLWLKQKTKKEQGQYPATLTKQAWSIKIYYRAKRTPKNLIL